ncbi:NAD(+) synthase [Helicobacter monodelphidis]|uniref:NAD(+) synthase n=1 Tax=Helicobacter sp. 15-1451 TaxID=2004995 RepID=UPI000DCD9BE5|nr:NAD(+) synthase [Helicobacter sp. 15-1451]RAX57933.1 NAD(+) synthase [Helicobacter sp. 15-1451]
MDSQKAIKALVSFVRTELKQRNFQKIILGLSGGIDSAVALYLAKLALELPTHSEGIEITPQEIHFYEHSPILAVLMPSTNSNLNHLADAKQLAISNGIPFLQLPLNHFEQALQLFYPALQSEPTLRMGNACARFRMTLLFDLAFTQNRIVLGTSNKSERMLGYGTIYGDLACGINPLGNIYKTDIFTLAQALGIPQKIIQKAPSADFFEGQNDELELGFTYDILDKILYDFVDRQIPKTQLLDKYPKEAVHLVIQRVEFYTFKREMPSIAPFLGFLFQDSSR